MTHQNRAASERVPVRETVVQRAPVRALLSKTVVRKEMEKVSAVAHE